MQLPFPVNIADVRFGLRAKAAAHQAQGKNSMPVSFDDTRLSLEDGAENGSEFPESHQSPLTAASTELELEHLIDTLKIRHSELVVVIATDVRDRLFLIEEISNQLSGALFVDIAADRLLAHPDFIHATRGVLTLSSAPLATQKPNKIRCPTCGDSFQVWSTDEQAMLVETVDKWFAELPQPPPVHIIPYVVSRHGLLPTEDMHSPLVRQNVAVFLSILFSFAVAGWGIFRIAARRGRKLLDARRSVTRNGIGHLASFAALAVLVEFCTGSVPLAMVAGVIGICFWWWSGKLDFNWASAMIWLNTVLLIAVAGAQFLASVSWALFGDDSAAMEVQSLLASLSYSASGGMAYPIEQLVAALAMTFTIVLSEKMARSTDDCDQVVSKCFSSQCESIQRPWCNAGLIVAALGLATVTAAPLMFYSGARQVTIFGRAADFSAFIALTAITLLALCGLIGAFAAASRINEICSGVAQKLREVRKIDLESFLGKKVQPLMWTGLDGERPQFLATPVVAHGWCGGALIREQKKDVATWISNFKALEGAAPVDGKGLTALYALLAAEMGTYQFCVATVACAAAASSLMVYLFPVSQATVLIVLNIIFLLLAGAYSGLQAASFEGNMVLSNVLCNRTQTREWSVQLFLRVVAPFIVLAIVVGIGQLPGVLDVGNGVLEALSKALKPGG